MEQNIYMLLAGDIVKFLVVVGIVSLFWNRLYQDKEEKQENCQENISGRYATQD